MHDHELNRRDFSKLTMAAFSGMLAGTTTSFAAREDTDSPLLHDPHICRGLNTCKGKGKGEQNACAGMGNCATVKSHSCQGLNDCKGQGACGPKPGENACKGKGGCEVPIKKDATWKKARKRFEELMTAKGQKFGPAPAKG
jgi:hypothetical protein